MPPQIEKQKIKFLPLGILAGLVVSYVIFTFEYLDLLRYSGPVLILVGYFMFRNKNKK